MLENIILFSIVGIFAGLVIGMLGSGASLLIIPSITFVLSAQHIAAHHAMQIAIGTFFAVAIVMLAVATYTHNKEKAILWRAFRSLAPGIVFGTILGGFLSASIPTETLKLVFAVLAIFIAVWLFFQSDSYAQALKPSSLKFLSAGSGLGLISGTTGIGSFTVPFLQKCGYGIKESVATSSMCSFIIACIGTVTYIFMGLQFSDLPKASVGFIYLPVFLPISLTSMLFSPLGARLAHYISPIVLKRVYSMLLIVVGFKILAGILI